MCYNRFMRKIRHHRNPLLREFCPYIWSCFRTRDICVMLSSQHTKYHSKLSKNPKFQQLCAEADEIAQNWNLGEEALADELDNLWKQSHLDMPDNPG